MKKIFNYLMKVIADWQERKSYRLIGIGIDSDLNPIEPTRRIIFKLIQKSKESNITIYETYPFNKENGYYEFDENFVVGNDFFKQVTNRINSLLDNKDYFENKTRYYENLFSTNELFKSKTERDPSLIAFDKENNVDILEALLSGYKNLLNDKQIYIHVEYGRLFISIISKLYGYEKARNRWKWFEEEVKINNISDKYITFIKRTESRRKK